MLGALEKYKAVGIIGLLGLRHGYIWNDRVIRITGTLG